MIPNPGYHNSGPQLSFSQQQASPPPFPPPSPGGKVHSQSASTPSPPVSLVHKVPRPPCPPPYRAPRTSEWSLDTMVNPDK